jgi:hypothetical protein
MPSVSAWIPVAVLWARYDYNPFTGELISKHTGKPVKLQGRAQLQVSYQGDKIFTGAGRVAYAWCAGAWPNPTVDHIDRNPWNNRFWNLREADHRTQCQNTRTFQGGVHRDPSGWRVRPRLAGERRTLGTYTTKEEAQAAYRAACEALVERTA